MALLPMESARHPAKVRPADAAIDESGAEEGVDDRCTRRPSVGVAMPP